jgi:threonine dehydrogenase-like Zn-dependent dehydrogenase
VLVDVPDPVPQPGKVIADVVCVRVDGTDDEIIGGLRRTLRADDYLIVGPESLGRAGDGTGPTPRHPLDPEIRPRPVGPVGSRRH